MCFRPGGQAVALVRYQPLFALNGLDGLDILSHLQGAQEGAVNVPDGEVPD